MNHSMCDRDSFKDGCLCRRVSAKLDDSESKYVETKKTHSGPPSIFRFSAYTSKMCSDVANQELTLLESH